MSELQDFADFLLAAEEFTKGRHHERAKWVTAFTAYQKALSEPYFDQDDESRQSNRAEVDRTYKALCALAEGG